MSDGYKAEADTFHLHVAKACPRAHVGLIVCSFKGLEAVLFVFGVDWLLESKDWVFTDKKPKSGLDSVSGCNYLWEVYEKRDLDYSGNVTVPCPWDKRTGLIVN